MDSSDKVRQGLVAMVCVGAADHLHAFSPLLALVSTRMGDKKQSVRKTARDGLCTVYCKHASSHLVKHRHAKTVPVELHCIPQQMLHCYGFDAGRDVRPRPSSNVQIGNPEDSEPLLH